MIKRIYHCEKCGTENVCYTDERMNEVFIPGTCKYCGKQIGWKDRVDYKSSE